MVRTAHTRRRDDRSVARICVPGGPLRRRRRCSNCRRSRPIWLSSISVCPTERGGGSFARCAGEDIAAGHRAIGAFGGCRQSGSARCRSGRLPELKPFLSRGAAGSRARGAAPIGSGASDEGGCGRSRLPHGNSASVWQSSDTSARRRGDSASTPFEYKLLCLLARNTDRYCTTTSCSKRCGGTILASDRSSLRVFSGTRRSQGQSYEPSLHRNPRRGIAQITRGIKEPSRLTAPLSLSSSSSSSSFGRSSNRFKAGNIFGDRFLSLAASCWVGASSR